MFIFYCSIVDPHHVDADADPYRETDPDPTHGKRFLPVLFLLFSLVIISVVFL